MRCRDVGVEQLPDWGKSSARGPGVEGRLVNLETGEAPGAQNPGRGLRGAEEAGLSRRDWPAQRTVGRVKDVNSYPKAKGRLQRDSSRRHGVLMFCVLSTVTRAQRFIRNYGNRCSRSKRNTPVRGTQVAEEHSEDSSEI